MKCPQCQVEMKHARIGDIDIGECTTCRGLWLDADDLVIVKDEVLPEMGWLNIDDWEKRTDFEVQQDPNFCPRCRDIALTCIKDAQSGTQVHLCTQCHGRWLPTGQFLNLINALLDQAQRTTTPEYIKLCLQQAKEMLTSDQAFLTEWKELKHILRMLRHRIFIDHPKLRSLLLGLQKSMPL